METHHRYGNNVGREISLTGETHIYIYIYKQPDAEDITSAWESYRR